MPLYILQPNLLYQERQSDAFSPLSFTGDFFNLSVEGFFFFFPLEFLKFFNFLFNQFEIELLLLAFANYFGGGDHFDVGGVVYAQQMLKSALPLIIFAAQLFLDLRSLVNKGFGGHALVTLCGMLNKF